MRDISTQMQARLECGATFLCRCWKITRRDGAVFGFTDHDRDLTFDGVVFKAGSGLDASVIESSTGLSVDNAQAVGALSDVSLSEADIFAGQFDGAEVWHWLVDWQQVELRSLLFRGTLGEIRRGKTGFEAELRGMAEGLNQPLGRSYLRGCDRILGDAKCGVDLTSAAFFGVGTVVECTKQRVVVDGLGGFGDKWFENGVLRWPDGRETLVKVDTLAGASRVLDFFEEVRLPYSVGAEVRAIAGCNKRAAICGQKFGNFLNFRGFPHIPGEDWVTSYPASGETHDGASLFGGA